MQKVKDFIKKHRVFIFLYLLLIFLTFFKIPYYIDAPGGLINIGKRIHVENGYSSKGSLNLAYVSEYEATIPLAILSFFLPSWDLYPKEENEGMESYEDILLRDQLWLKEAYGNAALVAYEAAGKEIQVVENQVFVLYIYEEAKTDLQMGDLILTLDETKITSTEDFSKLIQQKEVGEEVTLEVLHGEKKEIRHATIIEVEGIKLIGIVPAAIPIYEEKPSLEISYRSSESGPSGGLMVALAIYNALTEEDITGGLTIVGTGTIDREGNVGEIGGVDYKLKGASKKADIFFVPAGENYEEAMALKKKKKYDITIVPVSTFEEALTYLRENVEDFAK